MCLAILQFTRGDNVSNVSPLFAARLFLSQILRDRAELLQSGLQVVGVQDMSLLALPSPNHPIRQDDAVLVVNLPIYDDASAAVGFDLWCGHIVYSQSGYCSGASPTDSTMRGYSPSGASGLIAYTRTLKRQSSP